MKLGKLGVWYFTDGLSAPEAADTVSRIEHLGYDALWIPETVGRNPFVHASWLLSNSSRIVIATGIANIYNREPGVTLAAQNTLAEQSENRFLLGLGVSHRPLVEGLRGLTYGPPVATMRSYLERMAESPYVARPPTEKPRTVIAALGPKMLELAAERTDGAHPYFSSPAHTRMARQILGPDRMLCVEQKVILTTNEEAALKVARTTASTYQALPNYRNNWVRMGLTEADFAEEASAQFVNETFAWGSVDRIKERIEEHFDAGASHVCVQPIHPGGMQEGLHWEVLDALKPTTN